MRFIFITIIYLLQILFATSSSRAQQNQKGLLIVKSDPPGATVYFRGNNNVTGVTPVRLKPNFQGTYKILALKKGYETCKDEYFFKGTERGILNISLSPKTRLKAGMRSFVFTGWGQMYAERKTNGMIMSLFQIGTAIGALVSENKYLNAVDEYKDALKIYKKNEKIFQEQEEHWKAVEQKYKKADHLYDERQLWILMAGSIWIYNILDSILFFPSFNEELFKRSVPSISMNYQNGCTRLTLSKSL